MTVGTEITDRELSTIVSDARAQPSRWRRRDISVVFQEARTRYSNIAKGLDLDPDDAVSAAWRCWAEDFTDAQISEHADTLWAYTAGAVKRVLSRDALAQQKLTSSVGVRRAGVSEAWLVCDADTVLSTLPSRESEASDAERIPPAHASALAAFTHVLVSMGLTPSQREQLVETIADCAAAARTPQSASDTLSRRAGSLGLPLPPERVRALLHLALGTPKGAPGIVRLIGDGHPSPAREPHVSRLLQVALPRTVQPAA